jgi:hypothetical protein
MNVAAGLFRSKQGECSADFNKKQRFAAAILLFFVGGSAATAGKVAEILGSLQGPAIIPQIFAADSL